MRGGTFGWTQLRGPSARPGEENRGALPSRGERAIELILRERSDAFGADLAGRPEAESLAETVRRIGDEEVRR